MAVDVFEETKVSNIAIFNRDFRDGLPLTCIQPFSIGTIERVSQCVNTCKPSRKSAMQPFSIGTFEMGYYWRIYSTFLLGLLRGCPSARTHVNHLKSQLYSHFPSWPSRWVTTDLCTAIFRWDFRDGLPVPYIQPFSIGTFGMGYHWLTYSHFPSGLLRGFPSARTHVHHLESFGFDANETCISTFQKGDF